MAKKSQILDDMERQLTVHSEFMDELDAILISHKPAKVKIGIISKKLRFAWGSLLVHQLNQALHTNPSK